MTVPIVIRMFPKQDRFQHPEANMLLPAGTMWHGLWLPGSNGTFGNPPDEVVDLIVRKYLEATD